MTYTVWTQATLEAPYYRFKQGLTQEAADAWARVLVASGKQARVQAEVAF